MPKMSDARASLLINVLADAFDKAATTQATKWHAASKIVEELARAGYEIRLCKDALAKAPRSNSGKAVRPPDVRRSTSRAA